MNTFLSGINQPPFPGVVESTDSPGAVDGLLTESSGSLALHTSGVTPSTDGVLLSATSQAIAPSASQPTSGSTSPSLTGSPNHQLLPGSQSDDLLRAQAGITQKITGRNQTIRGTSDNDTLDGSKGKKNTLRGLGGNDTLWAGKQDTLVGGGGNDTLDARKGKGKNTLKGGGGNDTLWAKKKDTLLGNGGSDRLDARKAKGKNTLNGGGGNDILMGGSKDDLKGGGGVDEFWVVNGTLPAQQLRIRDFQAGTDKIGIQLSGITQFSDITLTQQGADTLLSIGGTAVALLQGTTAQSLSGNDFLSSQGTSLEDTIFPNRVGMQFSQSAQNQEDLQSQFTLYTIGADGRPIVDQAPYNPGLGIFKGAIANFYAISGQLLTDDDGNVLADSDGRALINPNTPYIIQNTIFDVGNLEAKLIQSSPIFEGRPVIQYTFFNETNGVRTDAFVRFLDYWDVGKLNDFDGDTDGFNDFPIRSLPPNFSVYQAVNSIDYIFEHGLLGLTEFVDFSTNIPLAPDIILQDNVEENLTTSSNVAFAQANSVGSYTQPASWDQFPSSLGAESGNKTVLGSTAPGFEAARQGEIIKVGGRRQTVKGTSGDDILDASKGKGKNRLKGLGGNDTLLAGKKDVLQGGGGNDTLDARKGKARNTLKGGGGNDELWAKKKDRLFGNGGSDRLYATNAKGKNILNGGGGNDELFGGSKDDLKGGRGSDIFWLAQGTLPNKPMVVQDFEDNIDKIGLDIAGLDPFSDLSLLQQGTDVVLRVKGVAIALLKGVNANQLTSQDFIDGSQNTLSVSDAIGRREGKQYSQTGIDETFIGGQFNVFELNDNGTPILDTLPGDSRVGLFPGAIRNYQSGSGQLTGTADETVQEFNPNGVTTIAVGVLKAELIDDPDLNTAFGGRNTIEYSILPSIGAAPVLKFRFDYLNPSDAIDGFNLNLGINSLAYIVENEILTQRFAIVEDAFDFALGSVLNTKVTRTYSKFDREIAGRSVLTAQFSLVDRQGSDFVTDQTPLATVGTFSGAIENYVDNTRGLAFNLGNLSASLSGTTVTYTISSLAATVTHSATLNLANTGLNINQAVNDLAYILENDLLQRAFFPS